MSNLYDVISTAVTILCPIYMMSYLLRFDPMYNMMSYLLNDVISTAPHDIKCWLGVAI